MPLTTPLPAHNPNPIWPISRSGLRPKLRSRSTDRRILLRDLVSSCHPCTACPDLQHRPAGLTPVPPQFQSTRLWQFHLHTRSCGCCSAPCPRAASLARLRAPGSRGRAASWPRSDQEHAFSGSLRTKLHSRRQPGWTQPCPRSILGWFRECCILTSPFLGVWLEQVSTLEESEREDSLNKQEENYNLRLHAAQSTGGRHTATGPFGERRHSASAPTPGGRGGSSAAVRP